MSNILIPVDYSFASHNAYHFGLHLAQKMGLDVLLVHYYSGAINPNEPLQFSGDGSIHGGHLSRLRQFAYPSGDGTKYALVSPPAGVNLTYVTATSLAPSADILKRARSEDVALVVMATRSTKRILGSWLGSTATTVSEACERPVFLIPPEVTFRQFDRIVVANNRTTVDPLPLWEIAGMANLYGAKVHFVHVEHPRKDLPLRFAPWEL
ncbi:MAG: universal stress protein, partial [Bacteroidota bacterium]